MSTLRAFIPLLVVTALILALIGGAVLLLHGVWDSTTLPDIVKPLLSGLIVVAGLLLLLFAHPLYDGLVQLSFNRWFCRLLRR